MNELFIEQCEWIIKCIKKKEKSNVCTERKQYNSIYAIDFAHKLGILAELTAIPTNGTFIDDKVGH